MVKRSKMAALLLLFLSLPMTAAAEDPAFASGWRESSIIGDRWAGYGARPDWCCNLDWKDPQRAVVFCTRDIDSHSYDGPLDTLNLATRYYNRGNAYFDLKRYDKALSDYDRAIEIDALPYAYNNRGLIYYLNGEYAAALADFDKRVAAQSFDAYKALLNRGDTLYKLGRFREAISSYSTALQREPRAFLYQVSTGHRWYKQDPRKDEAACRTAIAGAYYKRGLAHQKRGEVDQAAADTERSLTLMRSTAPLCITNEDD